MYADLKDSIFTADQLSGINQLQHSYEISKTHQQIEQLIVEQEINERTIRYQKIIWIITSLILIFVTTGLIYIFFQKKNLSIAYKVLFEKNLEIMNLQENPSKSYSEKVRKHTLNNEIQDEILDKILILMEDIAIVCDPQFSINKLAGLVSSNHIYVSQVINNVLKKNFRSFLNGYRIREAQRLFSEPDAVKYTIESVALEVGFKSKSSFYDAFKEITGITPNFYLKAMQGQQE
jgi:AraC-like DNA-binding protein